MTREEAASLLATMKWVLADDGETLLAGEVEDAELRLPRLGPGLARAYADLIAPRGRRWHVRLVLATPYQARAWVLLAGVLRSVSP